MRGGRRRLRDDTDHLRGHLLGAGGRKGRDGRPASLIVLPGATQQARGLDQPRLLGVRETTEAE